MIVADVVVKTDIGPVLVIVASITSCEVGEEIVSISLLLNINVLRVCSESAHVLMSSGI